MQCEILTQNELKELLRSFKEQRGEEFHLRSLGYFGSYARKQATPESDVDVVFVTDQPDLFMTVMMKRELEKVLKREVDVVRFREHMNPRFKARIEKEAIYV